MIYHGLRTPREEIAFTARPKIQSQSQIFRHGRSIFCLPHRPNFSDFFDLCLHWVSVVRVIYYLFRSKLLTNYKNVRVYQNIPDFLLDSYFSQTKIYNTQRHLGMCSHFFLKKDLLKVSKSQKHFFLKLHCPKNTKFCPSFIGQIFV